MTHRTGTVTRHTGLFAAQHKVFPVCLTAIVLSILSVRGLAGEPHPDPGAWTGASGLFAMLPAGGPNASRWLRDLRLAVGGWVDVGGTYNPAMPGDRFNGTVTFGDRSGTLQLNQAYLYLERPVDIQGDSWDLGGRVDLMFGTDAAFAQASGDPESHWDQNLLGNDLRFYQLAIPQLYLEGVMPVGNGLLTKLGHFYTIVGNESVMAPDNFFYSHTYLMQYGEPFTQTGVLSSYAITENLTVSAGAVTGSIIGGWDGGFDHNLEQWGFLGGLTWADGETSFTGNASHGVQAQNAGDWNLVSLVLHHDVTVLTHFTLQHDYGWAEKAVAGQTAEWYGLASYLTYDLTSTLSAGLRGEWFRDDEGFRVRSRPRISAHAEAGGTGRLEAIPSRDASGQLTGNTYYAITAGLNWKPLPWVTLRPNLRYDWADKVSLFDCTGGMASSRCADGSQWLLSADVILMF